MLKLSAPAAFRRLCVETSMTMLSNPIISNQPPSGGCVLKLSGVYQFHQQYHQPPSGGCVLKHQDRNLSVCSTSPAAFRRLCVETHRKAHKHAHLPSPAAFRRLCVETVPTNIGTFRFFQPPSGGCVLKRLVADDNVYCCHQPPSGGCVLKHENK